MRPRILSSLVLASLLFAAACGPASPVVSSPPPPAPPEMEKTAKSDASPAPDFRLSAPTPAGDVKFAPPSIQEMKLDNGLRVLLVERHDLPIVSLVVVTRRGAAALAPGVGGFLGAMLLQGSKTRSALEISDTLERLGAHYGATVDYDNATIAAHVVTPELGEALDVLGDVIKNPAFARTEIERIRSMRLTALEQENDQPRVVLGHKVAAVLYPAEHPYHRSLLGEAAEIKAVKASVLEKAHKELFTPSQMTIALTGDITKERALAEIRRVFGDWSIKEANEANEVKSPSRDEDKKESAALSRVAVPKDGDAKLILVDKPGSTQSFVAVALPGVSRKNPDFDAILVMNTILGGQFSSRLNMNLREKHAYTYGVYSRFSFRMGPGPFSAGGAIVRESTGPAIHEILTEIEGVRSALPSEEELEDAKTRLIRELPARFESTSETASSIAALSIYGLPLDEYATRPGRIAKVTREDVRRVAEKYLDPKALRVIVVGDAKAVEAQLKSLGLGELQIEAAPQQKKAPKKK